MRLNAARTRIAVVAPGFEYLGDVTGYLAKHDIVAAQVVEVEINADEAAEGVAGLLVRRVGVVDRSRYSIN